MTHKRITDADTIAMILAILGAPIETVIPKPGANSRFSFCELWEGAFLITETRGDEVAAHILQEATKAEALNFWEALQTQHPSILRGYSVLITNHEGSQTQPTNN